MPPRLSNDPEYWICRFCQFNEICFSDGLFSSNCRTCRYSYPVTKGKWRCGAHAKPRPISYKKQLKGCRKFYRPLL